MSKHVVLHSAAHFCTDLQWTKMVKLDDNDTGGAMAAQTHCANSTNRTRITITRKGHFTHATHSLHKDNERE